MKRKTFLTETQVKVLRLRLQNYTFSEIGRILGTSKSNAYAIYKAAMRNVEKAKETLRLYVSLTGGLRIIIPEGTSLDELVETVFTEANRFGISVRLTGAQLLMTVIKALPPGALNLRDGMVLRTLQIKVKPNGRVEVEY